MRFPCGVVQKILLPLKITDRICKDDRYTFNGIYDSGYGQTGEFTITLKKTETGFCLEAFESSFFE